MRRLLLTATLVLTIAAPASAASGWREIAHRVDAFTTDGWRYAAWQVGDGLTVLDTRTGRRRAVSLPSGCRLPRRAWQNETAAGALHVPRVRLDCGADVQVLDIDTGRHRSTRSGIASPHPRCRALRNGEVGSATTAMSADARLSVDRRLRLVLRRCHGRSSVLAKHVGLTPYPRLGGGWATWSMGGDPDDPYEAGPARAVRAWSLVSGRSVRFRPPRTTLHSCDGTFRGGYGWADHTATRLFWVATLDTPIAGEDCVLGAQRVFVRRLA